MVINSRVRTPGIMRDPSGVHDIIIIHDRHPHARTTHDTHAHTHTHGYVYTHANTDKCIMYTQRPLSAVKATSSSAAAERPCRRESDPTEGYDLLLGSLVLKMFIFFQYF